MAFKAGELRKKRIGVLMGGLSEEREISLRTGSAVLKALADNGFRAVGIDAGQDLPARLLKDKVDVAFIALHGRYGEDGCVQGLLEVMRIPYTGSGVLSSSLAMDKAAAKRLFLGNGVSTPDFAVIRAGQRRARLPRMPLIIKPVAQGSAIGVCVARTQAELGAAMANAFKHGAEAIAERLIEGRELTVSILDGKAWPVIEIRPREGLYDYRAKYTKGMTEFVVPARLKKTVEKRVLKEAVGAYNALGCSGVARADVMLDESERPYVLEVNTIPGMTELSLLPRSAAAAGVSYPELVIEMLKGAGLDKR